MSFSIPLLRILICALWLNGATSSPSCDLIGLCSVGKTKRAFTGDISTDNGLSQALEARSVHKEIILIESSSGQLLIPLIQTVLDFEALGYSHILPLAQDAEACNAIAIHLPSVGCAYSSFKLGINPDIAQGSLQKPEDIDMFHNKWRAAARAVRAGYNVLVMDTDVLLFEDPYKFWKAAPFKSYHLLVQADLTSEAHYLDANVIDPGIVYIQNAKPSGPTAWMVAEVSDRLLRWVEDGFKTLQTNGLNKWCNMRIKDMLNEVMVSALTGMLLFYRAVEFCKTPESAAKDKVAIESTWIALQKAVDWSQLLKNTVNVSGSDLSNSSNTIRWGEIKLPAHSSQFSISELGGSLFPGQRGSLSQAFRDQLVSACTSGKEECSLWKDVAEATAQNVVPVVSEKLMLMPAWMASSYHVRGAKGDWIMEPDRQVLGHAESAVLFPPEIAPLVRDHLRMAHRGYHWDAVHKVKGLGVYQASMNNNTPEVVAAHPDLLLDPTLTRSNYLLLLDSVIQVAQYTRKTIVWPSVPCALPWVLGNNAGKLPRPWPSSSEWIPYLPPESRSPVMCTWTRQLNAACLSQGQGITPLEFEHMKERYRIFRPMDASPEKTLMAKGRANPDYTKKLTWQPSTDLTFQEMGKQVATLIKLPGSTVVELHNAYRMHVVYIGQAIQVKYDLEDQRQNLVAQEVLPGLLGSHDIFMKSLPEGLSPASLASSFQKMKEKCVGEGPGSVGDSSKNAN
ncbi:hypothetical protein CEUSTIGMA_g4315.t1 [Chlamydomonas eustigma]|uniref:Nucleotide-diphospho-sugar transferase domain-containing protein n=1 Tax=Chlamydomonas eustigma TaxID=1157962 RepID=A0A250X1Q5_9CHLO|nr:hypothetical protein CEUSTIGMA_g4315.t1 [Chlamydomonas eustigma]|eukprot:GAX76869.1 hypothetical protein CEUSTIGMA_g4315.t1 [Chlamydomonas eustigma]